MQKGEKRKNQKELTEHLVWNTQLQEMKLSDQLLSYLWNIDSGSLDTAVRHFSFIQT